MKYKIEEIVANKKTDELPSAEPQCPYCRTRDVQRSNLYTTLVGGGTGIDDDPNHTHESIYCNVCAEKSVRETCSGNVWYTSQNKVLRGIPNCFEKYIYDCPCGAKASVKRYYADLNGQKNESSTTITEQIRIEGDETIWAPSYRVFFECSSCKMVKESSEKYYGYELKESRRKNSDSKINWVIKETIGPMYFNDKALARVNFSTSDIKEEKKPSFLEALTEAQNLLDKGISLTINGKKHVVSQKQIKANEVVQLAYLGTMVPTSFFSIVYYKGRNGAEGLMNWYDTIDLVDGIVFSCVITGNA